MTRIQRLRQSVEDYYKKPEAQLLFHGWNHIMFVTDKAMALAQEMNADEEIIGAAALVHDFDHVTKDVETARQLREDLLRQHDYSEEEIERINQIIRPVDLVHRNRNFDLESQILSDANILFKCLPITPIMLAGAYVRDNKVDLKNLAQKVVEEQAPLIENDTYFLTHIYKKRYLDMARQNIKLWQDFLECMQDQDVVNLMMNTKFNEA